MEADLLSDILTVEAVIRERVEAHELQAEHRLAAVRQQLASAVDAELERLQADLERALALAKQTALQEADALLAEARAEADYLERLLPADLDRVIDASLARILPGDER